MPTTVRGKLPLPVCFDPLYRFDNPPLTDCTPVFDTPSSTVGTCSAGAFNGCPCEKCGDAVGGIGPCDQNGCEGVQGTCTSGTFEGCTCD